MSFTSPSTTLWARCGEANSNARLEERLKRFLKSVVAEAALHSRFLNMLSLLEHIGSRKIMLSQMRAPLDKETLKHMAEEARHAFFFKHQAERLAGHALESYEEHETLCAAEAKMYFGRLDAGLSELAGSTSARAPYLLVSYIVELRAGWVYHHYEKTLAEAQIPLSLKSTIAEEEKHLLEMQDNLNKLGVLNDILLARSVGLETNLFTHLLDALTGKTEKSQTAQSCYGTSRLA